jgi:phenylacetate-coenzyme A ligase PaaK-like adenylate-forming protein
MIPESVNRIFEIKDPDDFQRTSLDVFRYQSAENNIYHNFVDMLGVNPGNVNSISKIPFLPAGFFRDHKIITGDLPAAMFFESSGTAGTVPCKHFVVDPLVYKDSLLKTFNLFYGDPSEYFIAALLPSYTERKNSSLVFMMNELIKRSIYPESGFYRDNNPDMLLNIKSAREKKRKILLIGVSYALIDLAEKYHPDLSGIIVMETGGMKGRRQEITRAEMHSKLKKSFNVESIHSEYGMTELLSQAYSKGDGIFYSPPWMKVLIRDLYDPLSIMTEPGKTGGINIIDLANINSCSFLATDDLGKIQEGGGFEVLGRLENSDIRGCNLMIE